MQQSKSAATHVDERVASTIVIARKVRQPSRLVPALLMKPGADPIESLPHEVVLRRQQTHDRSYRVVIV